MGFVEELVDIKIEKTGTSDMDIQIALQKAVLDLRKRLNEIVKKKNGNAIITYRQKVEDMSDYARRIVLRGYGTAALIEVDQLAMLNLLEPSSSSQKQKKPSFG